IRLQCLEELLVDGSSNKTLDLGGSEHRLRHVHETRFGHTQRQDGCEAREDAFQHRLPDSEGRMRFGGGANGGDYAVTKAYNVAPLVGARIVDEGVNPLDSRLDPLEHYSEGNNLSRLVLLLRVNLKARLQRLLANIEVLEKVRQPSLGKESLYFRVR